MPESSRAPTTNASVRAASPDPVEELLRARSSPTWAAQTSLDVADIAHGVGEGRVDHGVEHVRPAAPRCRRGAARCRGGRRRAPARGSCECRMVDSSTAAGMRPRRGRVPRARRRDRRCRRARRAAAGTSSVSTSRARGLVTAARRPKCQPRTVSAARRVAETERAKGRQRLGVVRRAGEDEVAFRRRQGPAPSSNSSA